MCKDFSRRCGDAKLARNYFAVVLAFVLVGCMSVDNVPMPVLPEATSVNQTTQVIENYTENGTLVSEQFTPPVFNYSEVIFNETTNQSYTVYSNFPIINETKEIADLKRWADEHGIELVGVNKSVNDFYYNGSKPEDFLPFEQVPDILQVANGLYKLPDDLTAVMRGKAFYLSYLSGRGYTVLDSAPEQGILAGLKRGSIIEQPLTEEQVIHEFAHILDYHGIRGMYEDDKNNWKHLDGQRAQVFVVPFSYDPNLSSPPNGYIDVYSTANEAENFAQHFMYYVLHGAEFREKTSRDLRLREKYLFFKEQLFNGREYD